MRSSMKWACVITVLAISAAGSGYIAHSGSHYEETYPPDGSGGGQSGGHSEEHTTVANATGDDSYTWGYGEGADFVYTTEDALCYYQYDGYIYADAEIWVWGYDWGAAIGDVKASASTPYEGDSVDGWGVVEYQGSGAHIWTDLFDKYPMPGERNTIYFRNLWSFNADEGIHCDHTACSLAEVSEGGYSYARSRRRLGSGSYGTGLMRVGHNSCFPEEPIASLRLYRMG
jgi:hypothetical protein